MYSQWCWVRTKTPWVGGGLVLGGQTVTVSAKVLRFYDSACPQTLARWSATHCKYLLWGRGSVHSSICRVAIRKPFTNISNTFQDRGILTLNIPFLGWTPFSKITNRKNIMYKTQKFPHCCQVVEVCLWGRTTSWLLYTEATYALTGQFLMSKRQSYKAHMQDSIDIKANTLILYIKISLNKNSVPLVL